MSHPAGQRPAAQFDGRAAMAQRQLLRGAGQGHGGAIRAARACRRPPQIRWTPAPGRKSANELRSSGNQPVSCPRCSATSPSARWPVPALDRAKPGRALEKAFRPAAPTKPSIRATSSPWRRSARRTVSLALARVVTKGAFMPPAPRRAQPPGGRAHPSAPSEIHRSAGAACPPCHQAWCSAAGAI